MRLKGKILIVDDNKSILSSLQMLLQAHFKYVQAINTPNRIVCEMERCAYDVVLLDMNFKASTQTGNEGIYWLRRIKELHPESSVVMITAYGDVELAVRALKEGATDFLLKPWDNENLVVQLQSALKLSRTKSQWCLTAPNLASTTAIIGSSPAFLRTMKLVHKVAKTDANILITGENGTGKELVAKEIHRLSLRAKQQMVSVDMGSVSESLFESELFGHVKGAFTDARASRKGKFEEADNSTLFLDEIGNLPMALQMKLLVALQNRHVVRVGTNIPIPFNIRLISATNGNLEQMVYQGRFREDLFFRINTIHIEVPPLRERQDDIADLAAFFLQNYSQKYNKGQLQLHADTIDKMKAYPWPGNIRELQHSIEKAVILSETQCLMPQDFNLKSNAPKTSMAEIPNFGTIEDMEREMICQSLLKHQANLSSVAEELGISRQTLYNKINKYNIDYK